METLERDRDGRPDRELYALLHLSPEASDDDVKRAYRQWAQVYHPDKHQTPQVTHSPLPRILRPWSASSVRAAVRIVAAARSASPGQCCVEFCGIRSSGVEPRHRGVAREFAGGRTELSESRRRDRAARLTNAPAVRSEMALSESARALVRRWALSERAARHARAGAAWTRSESGGRRYFRSVVRAELPSGE
jgi:hypothetical protein